MYINYFSIAFLIIALALSVANIYSMFIFQKYLKSDLIAKRFHLLKTEVALLSQKQTLHQSQTQFDAARLETLEKVLSALLASHAGFGGGGPDDGMIH
jgi:hypothetical protein